MHFVLDGIILAVWLYFIFSGFAKGFFKSLMGLATSLLAFLAASKLSQLWAPDVADKVAKQGLTNLFSTMLPDVDVTGGVVDSQGLSSSLSGLGLTQGLADSISHNVQVAAGSAASAGEDVKTLVAQELANEIALGLTQILLFLILFLLIGIVIRLVLWAVDALFHLPGLNFLNRLGGGALGVVQGAVVCGILCIAVSALVMLGGQQAQPFISMAEINQTVLFGAFYHNPILSGLLFG